MSTNTTPPAESEPTPPKDAGQESDLARQEKILEVEQDARVAKVKAEAEAVAGKDKSGKGENPDG